MLYYLCFVAVIASVCAQVAVPPSYYEDHPYYYAKVARHPRDVTWDKQVGQNGKVFGTLGSGDSGLFGKAGYDHQIFNDDRGKLNAQAYGTRVLGPHGDATSYGGKLDWANKNAQAGLELNRPMGGHTGLTATGKGAWNLDKNTKFSAGGFYTQPFLGHGQRDYGVKADFTKNF